MMNPFEQLEQNLINIALKLETIESKIKLEKRWLSTSELSEYIPYSKETINKKVQDETFICGIHFYQQSKIRMFDKLKIDEWIISNKLSTSQELLKAVILAKATKNI
jgi:hypothetical protein